MCGRQSLVLVSQRHILVKKKKNYKRQSGRGVADIIESGSGYAFPYALRLQTHFHQSEDIIET